MENLINVTDKELKALTWMEDVSGMVAKDCGSTVKVFYKVDPSFFVQEFTKSDFLAVVSGTTEKLN